MKKFLILFSVIALGLSSCTDASKDPILFDQVKQGSVLAVRGVTLDNLNTIGFAGKFSVSSMQAQSFVLVTDYISADITSLSKATIYAKYKTEARVKVAELQGSSFALPSATARYPRATISIPLETMLTAINKTKSIFNPDNFDGINISIDLDLKDGSKVPASAVVNSSLFESDHFYPAHNLVYVSGN